MFKDLHKIDWRSLKQAHGHAAHIPEAIKGLISDSPEIVESSYWKLDNHIVLQSDLYEAAFYVIPFMIEILKSNHTIGRNYVYNLLIEICNGYAPKSSLCTYKNEKIPLAEVCRLTIADEIDVYISEVSDVDSGFRKHALDLLLCLENYRAKIVPMLEQMLQDEPSTAFSETIRAAILELNGNA